MHYFIIILLLFALLIFYFKVADKYNIIDKPNHRSSHTQITLRGGGIIFPIAFVLYFVVSAVYRKDYFLPENYWVSNQKIKNALGIAKLPVSASEGLEKTIKSFK